METEGRELIRRTGEDNNVVTSSEWISSSLPQTAREVDVCISCCNSRELSTQPTNCTPMTNICDECSLGNYQKPDMHDPPPAYAEAISVHKNPPHQTNEVQNFSSTHTREVREAEAIAIDNEKKYRQRSKGCKRFTAAAVLLFAFSGFYLIHWNKQIAVRFSRNQEEALRNVVFVSNANVSKAYEGKLVHVIGALSISEPLTDPVCGFAVSSVKLKRFVHNSEIYMMVKSKEDCDDPLEIEPRYYYTRKGGDILLNSNQMCVNPKNMFLKRWDIKNEIQTAKEVKIGSLTFGSELKDKFNEFVYVTDKLMELKNDNAVRLMFSYAGKEGDTYSVIGKLTNGVIVPYTTVQGDSILLKRMYAITAEEMIRLRQFDSNFEFYRRSYVISLVVIVLSIAFVYYYKIHPLRPQEDH